MTSFIESKFTTKAEYDKWVMAGGQATAGGDLTVYYWPMFGRAGAILRMLEHTSTSYTLKSEFGDIASMGSAFGAHGDTFAPPIVKDGAYIISQSTACLFYIGKKCGLTKNMDECKAMQYVTDIVDTFEGGISKAAEQGGTALKAFLEGDGKGPSQFAKLMGNIERSIKGPFYFGEEPTIVDFFLCAHGDWQQETLLNRLEAQTSTNVFAPYPKVLRVLAAMRGMPAYKNYKGPLKTLRDGFAAKDEVFAAYK